MQAGTWERLFPGVYRQAGVPSTWRQSLIAACLAISDGAVASHQPAAGLFELVGIPRTGVEISCPTRRRVRGITTHWTPLARADVTVVDAIPVTAPARTLIDLATCVDRDVLEDALDDALRRGLVSVRKLRWRMEELGARTVLKRLVEQRAHGVTESKLETRVLRALRAAGLPKPAIQHRIGSYRVDFAYPTARIAIECDGYQFHSSRRSFDADRARDLALSRIGWRVLRVTWFDIEELIRTLLALGG